MDLVNAAAQRVLDVLQLRGEPEVDPIKDPAWAARVVQAVALLRGMGRLRIGGHF